MATAETDTVHGRLGRAREAYAPTTLAAGLALAAALGFALLFLQDPAAHNAVHDFRHAAGIVCH